MLRTRKCDWKAWKIFWFKTSIKVSLKIFNLFLNFKRLNYLISNKFGNLPLMTLKQKKRFSFLTSSVPLFWPTGISQPSPPPQVGHFLSFFHVASNPTRPAWPCPTYLFHLRVLPPGNEVRCNCGLWHQLDHAPGHKWEISSTSWGQSPGPQSWYGCSRLRSFWLNCKTLQSDGDDSKTTHTG